MRARFPGREALKAFLLSPIVMPKIVLGVGWFIFFARLGLQGGVLPLVLAHTIVVLPFVVNILAANLVGLDPSLEEAAQDLGASAPTVLWRVVLPQIRSGLAVSALLAFIVSFDQVESSLFLTRGENNRLSGRLHPLDEGQVTALFGHEEAPAVRRHSDQPAGRKRVK